MFKITATVLATLALCGAAQAVLGDAANTLTSFVLLACAIVIELVVLSIVRARMGHTGKEEVTKS